MDSDRQYVGLPCCAWLFLGITLDMNVYGIWLGMFADWWIRGAIFFYRMIHLRWLDVYFRKKSAGK
ncbi:hypothetical protein ACFSJQ_19815 [Vibrio olivae]